MRSAPLAIYRISPTTSAETFVTIGISIALESLFEYKIPKILLVREEQDIPSLLRGADVVEAVSTNDVKKKLKVFLPRVIELVRKTNWKPMPLPFVETKILHLDLPDSSRSDSVSTVVWPEIIDENTASVEEPYQIPIEELQISVRTYNSLKRVQINTVSDLLDYSQEDLLEIRNFGSKSAQEVVEALQVHLGIVLASEKDSLSFEQSREETLAPTHIEISQLIEKIASGLHADSDVEALRKILSSSTSSETGSTLLQLGKYNINIAEGRDINIGDLLSTDIDEKAIKELKDMLLKSLSKEE